MFTTSNIVGPSVAIPLLFDSGLQDFGFLDFDNVSGFGPENYVLTNDLAYDEALFGTYTFRLHGYTVRDENGDAKTVNYRIVVRKESEVSHYCLEGRIILCC